MKVAREKGLPELKHHLLPRTKAFTMIAKSGAKKSNDIVIKLKEIHAIFMNLN